MKRWIALMAVFCTIVMAGSGAITSCRAETLISFTDTNSSLWGEIGVFSPVWVHYISWTQTEPTKNTSIGAILSSNENPGAGKAWLTNAVGSGTTGANVIAIGTFTAPVLDQSQFNNFNTAPMTSLFSGLSLNPGTYYVVLQGEYPVVPGQSIQQGLTHWIGGFSPPDDGVHYVDVMVTTASGFTVGPSGGADLTEFPPSADWYASGPPDSFIFKVEGTVVPLPPTMWLLGSSLLGIVGWRRFRRS